MGIMQKDFIEALTEHTGLLRSHLEQLLERSQNEENEKNAIKDELIRLSEIFLQMQLRSAEKACAYCLEKADDLTPFGESDNEKILLRFWLLLDTSIKDYAIGVDISNEIFSRFLTDVSDDFDYSVKDQGINVKLLKVLRTVYQKQLINLIKLPEKENTFEALVAISHDLSQDLPELLSKEWILMEFYLNSIKQQGNTIDPQTHRLLALLDGRLAQTLRLEKYEEIILPELKQTLEQTQEGLYFLSQHNVVEDRLFISAGVYARFADAIRDSLVKLHESFERLYLDQDQRTLLIDALPFLDKIHSVLKVMGFTNLSKLTLNIHGELKKLCDPKKEIVIDEFNKLVSSYWILENCLMKLWTVNDSILPLNYDEIQNWTLKRSKLAALSVFATTYKEIRETIDKTESVGDLLAIEDRLLLTARAEQFLNINNQLVAATLARPQNARSFSKEELSEIALAFEYAANKNYSGGYVPNTIISRAVNLLNGVETLRRQSHPAAETAPELSLNAQQPAQTTDTAPKIQVNVNFPAQDGPVVLTSTADSTALGRNESIEEIASTTAQHTVDPTRTSTELKATDTPAELTHEEEISLEEQSMNNDLPVALDYELLSALQEDTANLEEESNRHFQERPVNEKSYSELLRIAHTLKGNANIIGLVKVAELVDRLEKHMVGNQDFSDQMFNQYAQAFASIFEEIRQFLSKEFEAVPVAVEIPQDEDPVEIQTVAIPHHEGVSMSIDDAMFYSEREADAPSVEKDAIAEGIQEDNISFDDLDISFDDIVLENDSAVSLPVEDPGKKKSADAPVFRSISDEMNDLMISFDQKATAEVPSSVPDSEQQIENQPVIELGDELMISFEHETTPEKNNKKNSGQTKSDKDDDFEFETIKFED